MADTSRRIGRSSSSRGRCWRVRLAINGDTLRSDEGVASLVSSRGGVEGSVVLLKLLIHVGLILRRRGNIVSFRREWSSRGGGSSCVGSCRRSGSR